MFGFRIYIHRVKLGCLVFTILSKISEMVNWPALGDFQVLTSSRFYFLISNLIPEENFSLFTDIISAEILLTDLPNTSSRKHRMTRTPFTDTLIFHLLVASSATICYRTDEADIGVEHNYAFEEGKCRVFRQLITRDLAGYLINGGSFIISHFLDKLSRSRSTGHFWFYKWWSVISALPLLSRRECGLSPEGRGEHLSCGWGLVIDRGYDVMM